MQDIIRGAKEQSNCAAEYMSRLKECESLSDPSMPFRKKERYARHDMDEYEQRDFLKKRSLLELA